MIYFVPDGGLANRMRTIASAIAFAKHHSRNIEILWHQDHQLNCKFSSLFKIPDHKHVQFREYEKLPLKYRLYHTNNPVQNLKYGGIGLFANMARKGKIDSTYPYLTASNELGNLNPKYRILIKSSSRFFHYKNIHKLFVPTNELNRSINRNTESFTEHTFGIHIRRTDHKAAYKHSPIKVFIEKIKAELKLNNLASFYLASDSFEVKKQLKSYWGDKIIMRNNELNRKTESGIKEALIEMFSLSKTKKIYGSYQSSYSTIAGEIGNIPVEQLTYIIGPA